LSYVFEQDIELKLSEPFKLFTVFCTKRYYPNLRSVRKRELFNVYYGAENIDQSDTKIFEAVVAVVKKYYAGLDFYHHKPLFSQLIHGASPFGEDAESFMVRSPYPLAEFIFGKGIQIPHKVYE